MATPKIFKDTPTLNQVWLYTYRNKKTRIDNMVRDILPSKIKILNKLVYAKNKEGKTSTPDERLEIISYSAPQYGEYLRVKGKKAKRQMKVKHHYSIVLALQKDENGRFSMNSKFKWRVGSNQKWDSHPSQNKIKAVYNTTKEKLKKKFTDKKTNKLDGARYSKEIDLIKKKGKYLSIGDYNSQEKGINGDFYWRLQPLCYAYNCLFGPLIQSQFDENDNDDFVFFDKHTLAVIIYLMKKNIIVTI